MKFWTQAKAPAGNWADRLGTDEQGHAVSYARGIQAGEGEARVVERTDVEVWPNPKRAEQRRQATTHEVIGLVSKLLGAHGYPRMADKLESCADGVPNVPITDVFFGEDWAAVPEPEPFTGSEEE